MTDLTADVQFYVESNERDTNEKLLRWRLEGHAIRIYGRTFVAKFLAK